MNISRLIAMPILLSTSFPISPQSNNVDYPC